MFKTEAEMLKFWNAKAVKALVGKKITQAEYVEDEEFGHVFAIVLEDGTTIIPMADDEGNHPGSLQLQGGKHGVTCLPTI